MFFLAYVMSLTNDEQPFCQTCKEIKIYNKKKTKERNDRGVLHLQNTTGETNTADILPKTGFQDTVK